MQELKDKSLQAREAVKDDVASLESTADVLDLNQAKLDENNERLKAPVKSMREPPLSLHMVLRRLWLCLMWMPIFDHLRD